VPVTAVAAFPGLERIGRSSSPRSFENGRASLPVVVERPPLASVT